MDKENISKEMGMLFPDFILKETPGFNYLQVQGRAGSGKTLYSATLIAMIAIHGKTPFETIRIYLTETPSESFFEFTYRIFLTICEADEEISFDAYMKRLTSATTQSTGKPVKILTYLHKYPELLTLEDVKENVSDGLDLVILADFIDNAMLQTISRFKRDNLTVIASRTTAFTFIGNDPDELPYNTDLSFAGADHSTVVGTMMSFTLEGYRALLVRRRNGVGNVTVNLKHMERGGSMRPTISRNPTLLPARNGD